MKKYLGAFVVGGITGFSCANTVNPKVASQHSLPSAPATEIAVKDFPGEHIRHMHVHKLAEIDEAKSGHALAATEQVLPTVDETPTGSIKPTKLKKAKRISRRKTKVTMQQEDAEAQAPSVESESPAPRGLFETLLQGN